VTPKIDHPLGRLQSVLRNMRDCTANAHTPEDDAPRREPPPASFPSMMLFVTPPVAASAGG
jgi:hypothetical protein